MPTGYTDKLSRTDDMPFSEFAWGVARAFLHHMRDDPSDAPIRDERVSEATLRSVEACEQLLDKRKAMTLAEAEADQNRSTKDLNKFDLEQQENQRSMRARYEGMLKQVEDWSPPSSAHTKFKEYMVSQIKESIRYDCRGTAETQETLALSAAKWRSNIIEEAKDALERSRSYLRDERKKVYEVNEWMGLLNQSLPMPVLGKAKAGEDVDKP